MKRILFKVLVLVSTLLLFACSNVNYKSPRMVALEQDIISGLKEEYPDENFYFIYGIDKEGSIATNIQGKDNLRKRFRELGIERG